jgi:hypothetical protein
VNCFFIFVTVHFSLTKKSYKMKKVMFALTAIAAMSFASCEKDHTCTCTNVQVVGTVTIPMPDTKKSDAEDACDAAEATYTGSTCSLD